MRKIGAHYIINPGEKPIRNGVIELDKDNHILSIRQTSSHTEESNLEFYNGVLIPGLVNVHTHMELSHLKNKITPGKGISSFVNEIVHNRDKHQINTAIISSELAKMYRAGTQAIGDISNTNFTIEAKLKSAIISHTFVELFGLHSEYSHKIWQKGIELNEEFKNAGLVASLTAHAPYSVSRELWQLFKANTHQQNIPFSIHHMESREEEVFMRNHSGPMAERFKSMGIDKSYFPQPKMDSTSWLSEHLPTHRNIILVHNTFCKIDPLIQLIENHPDKKFFFGICPNSNRYIENEVPETILQNRNRLTVCLGTDSLASTHSLLIWDEIKSLALDFPKITIEEYVEMACINGARALGLDSSIGDFQKGKKPGVVLIEGLDLQNLKITARSRTRRIV